MNNILVIAAHPDDESLGSGGTIAKFIEQGKNVDVVCMSGEVFGQPDGLKRIKELRNATSILGTGSITYDFSIRNFHYERQDILQTFYDINADTHYDLVITHNPNEVHQDHKVIGEESIRAFKNSSIITYNLPWNNFNYNGNFFVELKKEHLEKKIDALKCYKSQSNKQYMKEEYVLALARTRGLQIGVEFAENFNAIIWVM